MKPYPLTNAELRQSLAQASEFDPSVLDFSIREINTKPNRPRRYYQLDAWPANRVEAKSSYFIKLGRRIVQCEDLERKIANGTLGFRAPRLLSLRMSEGDRQLGVWSFEEGEIRPFKSLGDAELEQVLYAHAKIHGLTEEFAGRQGLLSESPWGEGPAMGRAADAAEKMGHPDLKRQALALIDTERELIAFLERAGARWLTHHDISDDNIHWSPAGPAFLDWESIGFARPGAGLWPYADLPPTRRAKLMKKYVEFTSPLGGIFNPEEMDLAVQAHHAFRAVAFGYRLQNLSQLRLGLSRLTALKASFL